MEQKYEKVTYRRYITEENYKKMINRRAFTKVNCKKVTYTEGKLQKGDILIRESQLNNPTRLGRLRARSGSRLPTARFRSGPRWERSECKGKAPSSEVSSVFCRCSAEKGVENLIWIENGSKITRRIPKWYPKAAKLPKNMILEQIGC